MLGIIFWDSYTCARVKRIKRNKRSGERWNGTWMDMGQYHVRMRFLRTADTYGDSRSRACRAPVISCCLRKWWSATGRSQKALYYEGQSFEVQATIWLQYYPVVSREIDSLAWIALYYRYNTASSLFTARLVRADYQHADRRRLDCPR